LSIERPFLFWYALLREGSRLARIPQDLTIHRNVRLSAAPTITAVYCSSRSIDCQIQLRNLYSDAHSKG
jgi:hypothetical protein